MKFYIIHLFSYFRLHAFTSLVLQPNGKLPMTFQQKAGFLLFLYENILVNKKSICIYNFQSWKGIHVNTPGFGKLRVYCSCLRANIIFITEHRLTFKKKEICASFFGHQLHNYYLKAFLSIIKMYAIWAINKCVVIAVLSSTKALKFSKIMQKKFANFSHFVQLCLCSIITLHWIFVDKLLLIQLYRCTTTLGICF